MNGKFAFALAALALAACQGADDADEAAAPAEEATVAATQAPAPEPTPRQLTIPQAIRGVWGLTEDDCTAPPGYATGLMTVRPAMIEFYESAGELKAITEIGASHIRANYAFSGEGEEWDREILLELSRGGEELQRTDFGELGTRGPITYTRCD